MSTLITGGNGLVGSQFIGNEYFKFSSKDYNLIKQEDTEKLFTKKFDSVIHCAAKVGGIQANMNFKGEFFHDNIMMNTNVIEQSRKKGVKNLVAFLSTCIFPDSVEYPLTEKKIFDGKPHFSNDAYAYSKRMVEVQIRAYREQYGLAYKSVIPTNIYGINDNYSIENGHVIPSLIHKCYLAKENGSDLVIWGSGKPKREFIYNKDVAYLSRWVLDNYNEDEPIILSTSQEISISDLVDIIVEIMDFRGNVVYDKSKPDGQMRKPSDNSKIVHYLPNYKFTDIYVGLTETITDFVANYDTIRK